MCQRLENPLAGLRKASAAHRPIEALGDSMATRSKPEKNPLFTVQYWDRQTASEKGDPNGDMIAQAVGYALSESELADQALSELFVTMTECTTSVTYNVVRRAYGSIESNSGRRNAIMAAAEVYFGAYWDNKFVRQFLVDIINAVQWASRRRDDIAHGIIWAGIKIDNVDYGSFLMPPEYNTGRTFAFMADTPDPLRLMRAKYRYTANNIQEWRSKFAGLREAIWSYTLTIKREEGRFPALEALLEPLMDRAEKSRKK